MKANWKQNTFTAYSKRGSTDYLYYYVDTGRQGGLDDLYTWADSEAEDRYAEYKNTTNGFYVTANQRYINSKSYGDCYYWTIANVGASLDAVNASGRAVTLKNTTIIQNKISHPAVVKQVTIEVTADNGTHSKTFQYFQYTDGTAGTYLYEDNALNVHHRTDGKMSNYVRLDGFAVQVLNGRNYSSYNAGTSTYVTNVTIK